MSDLVELSFRRPSTILARYRDHDEVVPDIASAVTMLTRATALSLSSDSDEAMALALRTAEMADMVIESRDGRLYLFRPGFQPAELETPTPQTIVIPTSRRPVALISITHKGGDSIFADADAAYEELKRTLGGQKMRRTQYHDHLTATARAATPKGLTNSIYNDVRKHGISQTRGKLLQYPSYIETSLHPEFQQWVSWFRQGIKPHDVSVIPSEAVMPYFKMWALMRLAREHE